MKINFASFFKNREFRNSSWIIAGKIGEMGISFFVSLWTARYLGPSNYGLINYVAAYIAFFSSFCTLGISSAVLINEFTKHPDDEGTTLGTAIVLRVLSSFLSSISVVAIIAIVDKDEPIVILIALVSSFSLVFKAFDTIEYWFQKRYLSKFTSIATFVGYVVSALYKVYLLATGKSVVLFAFTTTIDYIVIAVILFAVYKKYKGPKLRFSLKRSKALLSVSYHFILSSMMVAIYGQTDKVMLKHMLSETSVGYYSTAASLSTVWAFVLSAIIASMSPTIMKYKMEGNEEVFRRKNRQLYGIIFYISIFVSIGYTVLAPYVIRILYGQAYIGSVNPLRVITWYVAFSYLGSARDVWMVCENKQKYSRYMYMIASVANIFINYALIPVWGATGAAFASLITQILTSIVTPMLFKEMRPNVKLIFQSIILYDFIDWKKIMKKIR